MTVDIDQNSGFCFGVIRAIQTAEKQLNERSSLYCLGDIVHNNEEVNRLTQLGLTVITHEEFKQLHDTTVLIRAHGEPPETYQIAQQNHIQLIDATCPVVLNLQKNIKHTYQNQTVADKQILIYGKKGHAEVIGLAGQTERNCIILSSLKDINKIDFSKPSVLYSQTTQSLEEYTNLINEITKQYKKNHQESLFTYNDTICRLVANRSIQIQEFASKYDIILFVSGEKSSNGLYLYELCKKINSQSYFISHLNQIDDIHFVPNQKIGICGATSTPMWFMEKIKQIVLQIH